MRNFWNFFPQQRHAIALQRPTLYDVCRTCFAGCWFICNRFSAPAKSPSYFTNVETIFSIKITGLLIVLKSSVIFEIKYLYHSLFLSHRYLFLTLSCSHFILLPLQNRLCYYIQDTLNLSHRNNFCL